MKIVVIGGTGLIGSKVVERLKQKGHQAIAAAPNTGVNTITGEGLKEAMADAQVVIDLANSPSGQQLEQQLHPFRQWPEHRVGVPSSRSVCRPDPERRDAPRSSCTTAREVRISH